MLLLASRAMHCGEKAFAYTHPRPPCLLPSKETGWSRCPVTVTASAPGPLETGDPDPSRRCPSVRPVSPPDTERLALVDKSWQGASCPGVFQAPLAKGARGRAPIPTPGGSGQGAPWSQQHGLWTDKMIPVPTPHDRLHGSMTASPCARL